MVHKFLFIGQVVLGLKKFEKHCSRVTPQVEDDNSDDHHTDIAWGEEYIVSVSDADTGVVKSM